MGDWSDELADLAGLDDVFDAGAEPAPAPVAPPLDAVAPAAAPVLGDGDDIDLNIANVRRLARIGREPSQSQKGVAKAHRALASKRLRDQKDAAQLDKEDLENTFRHIYTAFPLVRSLVPQMSIVSRSNKQSSEQQALLRAAHRIKTSFLFFSGPHQCIPRY